jgi:transcriptional regulator with XRE-family HTH domain
MANRELKLAILRKFNTQADFAQAVGCSEPVVSRVLRGRKKLKPTEAALWKTLLRCQGELISTVTEDVR